MGSKQLLFCFLAVACALTLRPTEALAQYDVPHAVLAGGGGVATGTHIVYGTVGQPVIGVAAGGDNRAKAGFWYLAGISSTVDVAFAACASELREDAVVLSWTPSAGAGFDGYNVYRSETAEKEFVRINPALVHETSYRDETAAPGNTYIYRIGAVNGNRESFSLTMTVTLPPKPLTLYQNYPNPFNPSTAISLYNPVQQPVNIAIYDVSGARVRMLCNRVMAVGKHSIPWNGTNDAGVSVGSGVYYYRLIAGKTSLTKKMVVVR